MHASVLRIDGERGGTRRNAVQAPAARNADVSAVFCIVLGLGAVVGGDRRGTLERGAQLSAPFQRLDGAPWAACVSGLRNREVIGDDNDGDVEGKKRMRNIVTNDRGSDVA